jgi:hypothetical protein
MKLDIIINERDTLIELTKRARNEYLRMNDITDERKLFIMFVGIEDVGLYKDKTETLDMKAVSNIKGGRNDLG